MNWEWERWRGMERETGGGWRGNVNGEREQNMEVEGRKEGR